MSGSQEIYVICRLGGLYSENRDQGLENAAHFFPIRTDPKPAKNMFNFFPAVNWLTNGFVYATVSLNHLLLLEGFAPSKKKMHVGLPCARELRREASMVWVVGLVSCNKYVTFD